jgi:hypothetical protein
LILLGQFLALEDPPLEFYEKLVKLVAAFEPVPALHNTSVDSFPLEELPEDLMLAPWFLSEEMVPSCCSWPYMMAHMGYCSGLVRYLSFRLVFARSLSQLAVKSLLS